MAVQYLRVDPQAKMVNIYMVPSWFFGYDAVLEIIFAIVTLLVAIYAFKVYRLSCERQPLLFGVSFLMISISYIIQSILNITIISELNKNICRVAKISNVNTLNAIGIYSHVFLFMFGLIILTYMTFRIKNPKVLFLLFIITTAALWGTANILHLFYLISSILLIYISIYYLTNYFKNRQKRTLLVMVAFIFLLFGSIHFIFSVDHGLYYVIGHILGLVAYLLILTNLIVIIRKPSRR